MEKGVPVDIKKAVRFYQRAIDLGDTESITALGDILADPKLDAYNIEEARSLYEKAYEYGDVDAPVILARTYNHFINDRTRPTNVLDPQKLKDEDIKKAREWYEKAIQMENYDIFFEYAETYALSGDFENGIKVILKGLDVLTETKHPDTAVKAHLYSLLAGYYGIQGLGSDAMRVMELAENLIEKNDYWDPATEAMIYRDYAAVLNTNGYKQKALRYYEKSEDILKDEDYPDGLAATLNGKAIVYEDLGEYKKAIEIYEDALRALEGTELVFDGEHTLAYINANIVHSLIEIGQYEKALLHAQKATEIIERLNEGHPWHFRALSDLARVFEKLNRVDDALITHTTCN